MIQEQFLDIYKDGGGMVLLALGLYLVHKSIPGNN